MRKTFPCCDEIDDLLASGERLVRRLQAVVDHDPDNDLAFDLYNTIDDLADLRRLRDEHRAFHEAERERIQMEAECVVLNAVADQLTTAQALRRLAEPKAEPEMILDWRERSRFAQLTARYAVFGWYLKHGEWPTPQQAWQACADDAEVELLSARELVGHAMDTGELLWMPTVVAIREGTAKDHGDPDDVHRLYVDEKHHESMRWYWDHEHRVERRIAELTDDTSA